MHASVSVLTDHCTVCRAVDGKMEQSFVNFQQAFPQWEGGNAAGKSMMNTLNTYRQMIR